MRPFVMDFPKDKKAIRTDNEYMFGRNLLVMPVTDSLYTYLDPRPKRDTLQYRCGQGREERKSLSAKVPNGTTFGRTNCMPEANGQYAMPHRHHAGVRESRFHHAFGPAVQYTSEKKWDNLEIRIYPGADGEFTLYEDEGDNYNYEKGAFSQIRFHWDDATRTLTIDDRKGEYKGMLKKRNFRILVVDRQSPSGDKEPTQFSRSVRYNGKAQAIKL